MKKFSDLVSGISQFLDRVAGFCIAGAVLLIVVNIILRIVFRSSFLGTYEYVGFIMAVSIGFSLAYCAVQESHIMIDFFVKDLGKETRESLETVTGLVSCIFLVLVALYVGQYAANIRYTGQVSPTTEIAFYPFIYLVALGLFMMAVVMMIKSINSIQGMVKK